MWFPKTQLLKLVSVKTQNSIEIADDHPGFQLIVTRNKAYSEYSSSTFSKQHFFKHIEVLDIAGDYTLFEIKVKKPILNLAYNLVQL